MKIEWVEVEEYVPLGSLPLIVRPEAGLLIRIALHDGSLPETILIGDRNTQLAEGSDLGYYGDWHVIAYSASLCDIVKEAKKENSRC